MIGKVQSISDWDSRTEILYGCAKCGASFRILSTQEKYCHNCGEKVDWKYMPLHLTKPLIDLGITNYADEKEFLKLLNEKIQNKEFKSPSKQNVSWDERLDKDREEEQSVTRLDREFNDIEE